MGEQNSGGLRSGRGGRVGLSFLLATFASWSLIASLLVPSALARATPRIVGGGGSLIASFPFQVALFDPQAGSVSGGFFCGGVIIDATHVATAAHCLIDEGTSHVIAPRRVAVLAGSSRLTNASASFERGAVQNHAAATAVDPNYDRATSDYDIGVVTLTRPFWSGAIAPAADGSSPIAPIAVDAQLADTYANPETSISPIRGTVSGWGDTTATASLGRDVYPNDLRSVRVPLVSTSICLGDYSDPFSPQPITARMLCAGGRAGGGDSCYGDSGGPLVVDRDNPPNPPSDYVLAGLVSFGDGCAEPERPGVYSRIADPAIANFLNSAPSQSRLNRNGTALQNSQPPTLNVLNKRCTTGRCTVTVLTTVRPGGAAVRTVHATLGSHQRGTCRRRGERVVCVHLLSRTPRVKARGDGRFLILASDLRPGRWMLTLTAISQAGLHQARPTRVVLAVR